MLIYLIIGLCVLLLTVMTASQVIALAIISGYLLAGIVLVLQSPSVTYYSEDTPSGDGAEG